MTKKMMKRVRDIENIARKKFPRTNWMRGGVEGIVLITLSSVWLSKDSVSGLGIPELERERTLGAFRQTFQSTGGTISLSGRVRKNRRGRSDVRKQKQGDNKVGRNGFEGKEGSTSVTSPAGTRR